MKKKNQLNNILTVLGAVAVIALGYWWYDSQQPGQYDKFAQCLTEKGAKFYGAFWCPHCQAQKALFGKSKEFLPYIECSTPDTKGQLQICKDKNIQSYPTWSFQIASSTGTTTEEFFPGEKTFAELGLKTGCVLDEKNN
jgi:thiol-disulfide isomerase/thioredoxin